MPTRMRPIHYVVSLSIAFVLVASVLFLPATQSVITNLYEEASYRIAPSAEKAYEYGSRHFSSGRADLYDINRAEHFFNAGFQLDPNYPNLRHQLSRISFLRGDFPKALELIDLELENNSEPSASTYYVRGLILGYMERYEESADDYERFLDENPINWAAINDYAWVLLKAGRTEEAAVATLGGLRMHNDNPWLLNTSAIALYELGHIDEARHQARAAIRAVRSLEEGSWSIAYPGNDPRIAQDGLHALQNSIMRNMHTIADAARSGSYNE